LRISPWFSPCLRLGLVAILVFELETPILVVRDMVSRASSAG